MTPSRSPRDLWATLLPTAGGALALAIVLRAAEPLPGGPIPAGLMLVLVFAGAALAAWIDDFTRIGPLTLVLLGVLTVLAWIAEFAAAALGARRVGASALALAGATIGTIAGVFLGILGLLFLPLAGAAVGEYLAQRNLRRAGRIAVATWVGLALGTAVKVAIVFAMLGIFVAALLL